MSQVGATGAATGKEREIGVQSGGAPQPILIMVMSVMPAQFVRFAWPMYSCLLDKL